MGEEVQSRSVSPASPEDGVRIRNAYLNLQQKNNVLTAGGVTTGVVKGC